MGKLILNIFYVNHISKTLQHEINLKLSMSYFAFLKYQAY